MVSIVSWQIRCIWDIHVEMSSEWLEKGFEDSVGLQHEIMVPEAMGWSAV